MTKSEFSLLGNINTILIKYEIPCRLLVSNFETLGTTTIAKGKKSKLWLKMAAPMHSSIVTVQMKSPIHTCIAY